MKKLLITGASGFLGIRTTMHYITKCEVVCCGHAGLDITHAKAVESFFEIQQPDVVFHLAAISDTGYSELHPDESEAVNLQGTINIAKACARTGSKLIYMSSDQVYNGNTENGLLPEDIELTPENVYGRHKLQAEREVQMILPEAVGLRLSWMYDLPNSHYRLNRNLLVNLKTAFENKTYIKAATREMRGITNVWDVVYRLEDCVNLPGGIYNFGSENHLNSYETFLETAYMMGLEQPEQWIIPDSERFPEHPRNLTMDTTRIQKFGIKFPDTLQGIQLALGLKNTL